MIKQLTISPQQIWTYMEGPTNWMKTTSIPDDIVFQPKSSILQKNQSKSGRFIFMLLKYSGHHFGVDGGGNTWRVTFPLGHSAQKHSIETIVDRGSLPIIKLITILRGQKMRRFAVDPQELSRASNTRRSRFTRSGITKRKRKKKKKPKTSILLPLERKEIRYFRDSYIPKPTHPVMYMSKYIKNPNDLNFISPIQKQRIIDHLRPFTIQSLKYQQTNPIVYISEYMSKLQQLSYIKTILKRKLINYLQKQAFEPLTYHENLMKPILEIINEFEFSLNVERNEEPLDLFYNQIQQRVKNFPEMNHWIYNWENVPKPYDQNDGTPLKTATYLIYKDKDIYSVIYNWNIDPLDILTIPITIQKQYVELSSLIKGFNFKYDNIWLIPYISENPDDWSTFLIGRNFSSVQLHADSAKFFPLRHAVFTTIQNTTTSQMFQNEMKEYIQKSKRNSMVWYLVKRNLFKKDSYKLTTFLNSTHFAMTLRMHVVKKLKLRFS